MNAPELSPAEAAIVARFGIFDDENRAAAKALREAGRGGHFTRDGQRWAADRADELDPS